MRKRIEIDMTDNSYQQLNLRLKFEDENDDGWCCLDVAILHDGQRFECPSPAYVEWLESKIIEEDLCQ